MNSSRETLLREKEEEKKWLRYLIGLESNQDQIPWGQASWPLPPGTSDIKSANMSLEIISDDDASDFILLKDFKALKRINLKIHKIIQFKTQRKYKKKP